MKSGALVPLWENRGFVAYWWARILSTLAYQMVGVVVGWQVYMLTHDVFYLGMIGLAQFLPILVMTLPAGQAADHFDRRMVLVACRLGVVGIAALLGWTSYTGGLGLWGIFSGVVACGVSRAFDAPANAAVVPSLVTKEQLPQALAVVTSATQFATIVGPAMGGLLYLTGAAGAYAAIAGAYAVAGGLMFFLPALRHGERGPVTLTVMLAGLRYIWREKMILGAISLDLMAVLLGGATALLPVYAHDVLHTGPVGLGLLRAAPAVGALALSIWLARYPLRRRAGETMFVAVAVFGLATIAFGLSESIVLSFAALVVLGASDVVSVVVRGALVQLATPEDMRGRVSAVYFLFIGTSNQLGEFESGVTASLLGTVPAVVLGGLGTLMVAALWWKMFPALKAVDDLQRLRPRGIG